MSTRESPSIERHADNPQKKLPSRSQSTNGSSTMTDVTIPTFDPKQDDRPSHRLLKRVSLRELAARRVGGVATLEHQRVVGVQKGEHPPLPRAPDSWPAPLRKQARRPPPKRPFLPPKRATAQTTRQGTARRRAAPPARPQEFSSKAPRLLLPSRAGPSGPRGQLHTAQP